jgi:hypothetical protein
MSKTARRRRATAACGTSITFVSKARARGAVNPRIEQYMTVDGNRFLILKQIDRPPRPIDIVVNWPALLNK